MRLFPTALATALLLTGLPPAAADPPSRYAKEAERAAQMRRGSVTVYVDADWGNRRHGAAERLTEIHDVFGRYGYELVDVEPQAENQDLEGFFVSYVRRDDPAAR